MRFFGNSSLSIVGISLIAALAVACGGSKQEANAPTTDAARVGSAGPDQMKADAPAPPEKPTAPVNDTAAASKKDDGSDIVPPFPSAGGKASPAAATADKDSAAAPAAAKKSSKKSAKASKKKAATASN